MSSPVVRVSLACHVMTDAGGPVPVDDLAARAACSPRQLQRDFVDVLGISPRQYGQALRSERTRATLRTADSILDAAFEAGYGSVRGFYEETARRLGMTPSEYASGAPEQVLLWSVRATGIGDIVAVATPRGLAAVRIGDRDELLAQVAGEFPQAMLERDDAAMADVMDALAALAVGRAAPSLPLDVQGTAFQARVWSALQDIPAGETRTYAEVAETIGSPTSVRAVARACATNKVALAVPCHRVVRSDGSLAGYRWGLAVKRTLLQVEGA
ncbi:MAG: methylated-DNA--[protein]-cysteine S-methyltransferase [Actinomycetales bacterium]|nr:methylated-DNA--[protein]-cysteine S-methyltransferase [Actinomycetales bacterium]